MRLTQAAALLLAPALMAVSAVASTPKSEAPANTVTPVRRVSTGPVAPVLVSSAIRVPAEKLTNALGRQAKVVLSFYVDEKGQAQGVRVTASANPEIDALVVDGILHSKFRPATLDHQAIPLQMSLVVKVQQ
jgi:outer membrane biosynthesis protein TonB